MVVYLVANHKRCCFIVYCRCSVWSRLSLSLSSYRQLYPVPNFRQIVVKENHQRYWFSVNNHQKYRRCHLSIVLDHHKMVEMLVMVVYLVANHKRRCFVVYRRCLVWWGNVDNIVIALKLLTTVFSHKLSPKNWCRLYRVKAFRSIIVDIVVVILLLLQVVTR